jgi:hypothetical protein
VDARHKAGHDGREGAIICNRGVVGAFHKMSSKYMPLYVAEFYSHYNNRSNPDMFRTR